MTYVAYDKSKPSIGGISLTNTKSPGFDIIDNKTYPYLFTKGAKGYLNRILGKDWSLYILNCLQQDLGSPILDISTLTSESLLLREPIAALNKSYYDILNANGLNKDYSIRDIVNLFNEIHSKLFMWNDDGTLNSLSRRSTRLAAIQAILDRLFENYHLELYNYLTITRAMEDGTWTPIIWAPSKVNQSPLLKEVLTGVRVRLLDKGLEGIESFSIYSYYLVKSQLTINQSARFWVNVRFFGPNDNSPDFRIMNKECYVDHRISIVDFINNSVTKQVWESLHKNPNFYLNVEGDFNIDYLDYNIIVKDQLTSKPFNKAFFNYTALGGGGVRGYHTNVNPYRLNRKQVKTMYDLIEDRTPFVTLDIETVCDPYIKDKTHLDSEIVLNDFTAYLNDKSDKIISTVQMPIVTTVAYKDSDVIQTKYIELDMKSISKTNYQSRIAYLMRDTLLFLCSIIHVFPL